MKDSFKTHTTLKVSGKTYNIWSLKKLQAQHDISRLPYAHKILLENLLRNEDGSSVNTEDIKALINWDAKAQPSQEIAFRPSRVLLQDFTGVPAVVDLAAMRDAMKELNGDPNKINPLQPAELIIDHSVQVDKFGTQEAFQQNAEIEFERNKERYTFLRWGQKAFDNFKVVPPDTGIVHQINLEYLARVIFARDIEGKLCAYPDTLVGTDSHTTMINGIGVLGWGVGGIEAEAAMLGQPISMLIPQVVGFKLTGELPEGATATDLVLRVVQMLREKGVVGKFVEYFGEGLANLQLADRATIANMGPEYGATCGIFPIDEETLNYLRFTGRTDEQIALVEAYAKEQGMFYTADTPQAVYSDTLELDMSTVEPAISGPKRPQDRINLREAKEVYYRDYQKYGDKPLDKEPKDELSNGSAVVAAITSCTNTSNPPVLIAAGLVAKKAVEKGLERKPWVKTSLAPGSMVVTDYLNKAGLSEYLDKLGFNLVGYGCTTCIGNSGPLPEVVANKIKEKDLVACSVLSGNRNFEGRIHALIKMNYLASPPLVVAYSLVGRMDHDMQNEPLGKDKDGNPVYLKDIWPTQAEVAEATKNALDSEMFKSRYADVFKGSDLWNQLEDTSGDLYDWDDQSTYVKLPPYFVGMSPEPEDRGDITDARVLVMLGDSVTTDHISPAGVIDPESPAGKYLIERGVEPKDFNSYGSRRGNHEVMMRGTFANIRLRNQLAPGTEGGWTVHLPDGKQTSIFEASMKYQEEKVPLVVLAGKEYGSGSSRDWAAKGTALLGVRAVIAESFERIHRSNLVGMGVLPMEFMPGQNIKSLGLTGKEVYQIEGLENGHAKEVTVKAITENGDPKTFNVKVRLDTPNEILYYQNGGILHYVLRQLLK